MKKNVNDLATLILRKKENSKGLHINEIVEQIMSSENTDLFNSSENDSRDIVKNRVNDYLNKEAKKPNSEISRVKNPKTKKDKRGYYRVKQNRPTIKIKPINTTGNPEITPKTTDNNRVTTNYIGKAGECAVMSELLFRGYNVNSMLVDEGVDIVASKDNIFYYVQVKTTVMNERNTIHASINQVRFSEFLGSQIRYVVVGHCEINGVATNLMFVFNEQDIQRFVHENALKVSNNSLHIKIKFDEDTNKPLIYDGKISLPIDFYLDKFL